MNSIDSFTTTANDLVFLAQDQEPDGVFVDVDDVEHEKVKGKRAIMPTMYTRTADAVVLELGEYGSRTYAPDDMVTWHIFRYNIPFTPR